jgi:hypothetical protein
VGRLGAEWAKKKYKLANDIIAMSSMDKIIERAKTQEKMHLLDHTQTELKTTKKTLGHILTFRLFGNTGNIYTITFKLDTQKESGISCVKCSCPYNSFHHKICKHIFFIYIKILLIPENNLYQTGKLTCANKSHLIDLYNIFVAGIHKPENIHESRNTIDDDCPVCFDKLEHTNYICKQCKNSIHHSCIREIVKFSTNCPLCRFKLTG